jgi:hypothetical protein
MMPQDDDLSASEREALATLRYQHEPSRLLEERTVRALQSAGLLRTSRRSRWLVWAIAAAASAVLYLGGVATGQWLSNRQTTRLVTDLQRDHALEAAVLVQQTGTAYTQAISALRQIPRDAADSLHVSQGREVALTALYSAANELVRLTPDDPVVVRILQVMEHERNADSTTTPHTRRVIWF